MQTIKEWALSVAAAAVISSVITVAGAHSPGEKMLKFAAGIVVVLSFVLPFVNSSIDFKDYTNGISELISSNELEKKARQQTCEILEGHIVAEIKAFLAENGISVGKVDADVYAEAGGEISIKSIKIHVFDIDAAQKKALLSFVSESYGVEAALFENGE